MAVSRVSMSKEGPLVSRLAQGWASAVRRGLTVAEATRHVHACLEVGITTMDNAAIYGGGQGETLLGEALAAEPGLRDRVEIVTKCSVGSWGTSLYHYDTSREHILSSVEHSLQELRTERIDLLLIHRPDPLMDADEVAEAFDRLYAAGKVLHFGVSNFTPWQFTLLASRMPRPLVTNEVQISVLDNHTMLDGTLDQCQQLRIRPMAWSPLGGGRLFTGDTPQAERLRTELGAIGEALGGYSVDQVALAWLLQHPAGILPILGTFNAQRLAAAAVAEGLALTREQWFRIWVAGTGERLP
ncbi:MAG: aldo/keto reductase [Anaerolineae bacterium]|jgi:predicted oxidoreductase|nr:oxidoreductase [Chloroflexota bacterium]